ncbi:MAG: HlyD family secretion protein [Gemmataceae bacterium]
MSYTTPGHRKGFRRFMPYIWVLGVLTLIVSVGGSWILHTQAADKTAKEDKGPGAGASDSLLVGIGYVDTKRGMISLFPTEQGRVVDVLVDESAKVAKGTPLLKIDDQAAKMTLGRAEADLKAAEAVLLQAQKAPEAHDLDISMQKKAIDAKQMDLDRANEALKSIRARDSSRNSYDKAVSDEAERSVKMLELAVGAEQEKLKKLQLDDPKVTLTKAQADVEAKKLRRDLAQLAVDECVLKAPMDGSVVRLQTAPGDVFGSPTKQAAMLFCSDEPRIVRADFDQEFANRLKVGQTADISDNTGAPGKWRGKVTRISGIYTERRNIVQSPFQFNDVRTLECIIELDPNQEPLRINQLVRVALRN